MVTAAVIGGVPAVASAQIFEGSVPRKTAAEALADNPAPPPECIEAGRNSCRPTAVVLGQIGGQSNSLEWAWYATGWHPVTRGCQPGDMIERLKADAETWIKVDCSEPGAVVLPLSVPDWIAQLPAEF